MLLSSPNIVVVNSAGQPYALARMYTYRATTLTNLPTYTTGTYGVEHTNPVVADANGVFPPIYVDPSLGYNLRIIVKDASDVAISGWDIDNIPRADSSFPASSFAGNVTVTGNVTASANVRAGGLLECYAAEPRVMLSETDRGTDLKNWDIDVQGGVLSIRTRTDADGLGKNAIVITRGSTTEIASIAIGNAADVPAITINGNNYIETGSFTATLSGMTSTTTGTINYIKTGRIVTLYAPNAITGTSNTVALGISGIPAACYPVVAGLNVMCQYIQDNGVAITCAAVITSGGMTFTVLDGDTFPNFVAASGAFTASGPKGLLGGWSITYPTNS